jgi:hypothetical protein
MPRVKFITTGHSHLVGNFSAGDTYQGDKAVCRHFVDDAHCAVWDEEKQAAAPAASVVQASGQAVKPAKAAAKPRTPTKPPAPDSAEAPAPADAPPAAETPAPVPASDSAAQGDAQAAATTGN